MPDKNTWEFINTFAPWLSAIGTIAAVIVSLYLSMREKRIKLSVSAGHRIIFPGKREILAIKVINKGFRKAKLVNIGWKIGILKKQYAVQTTEANLYSDKIPIILNEGEDANFHISFNDLIEDFSKNFVKSSSLLHIRSLKVQAWTVEGKTFESRIEKNLREKISEEINRDKS